jgi:acyl-CoA thioester hydrolase
MRLPVSRSVTLPGEWPAFGHRVEFVVRFADLDALGHLNNVSVVTMCETGRVEFTHDAGLHDGTAPGFVVASLHVDFRAQGFYRDELALGTSAGRIGRTSITLKQRLWRPADDTTLAEATSVLVVLGEDRRTPAPVPDGWRARLIPG